MGENCHYVLHYEYSDARGRMHKMSLSTDSKSESDITWKTMALVLNAMRQNGTLTNFSGFTTTGEKT